MNFTQLLNILENNYSRLDPHHDTWELWIKGEKTEEEKFEVAIGTILVQNTNWKNVDKAISNLRGARIFSYDSLQKCKTSLLENLIQPAGFYKQKASYLKSLSSLMISSINSGHLAPTRQELLKTKGIGNETADSILVYCFQLPTAIIGTYTRRLFSRLFGNSIYLKKRYEEIQKEITSNLPHDAKILGRFHALIVVHSQNICQKNNPKCSECFLLSSCDYGKNPELLTTLQEIIAPQKNKQLEAIYSRNKKK